MPRVRLSVTLPTTDPLGTVSRAHPSARFRVRSALPAPDRGGALLVDASAGDLPAVVAALAGAESVTAFDVLDREADTAVCLLAVEEASPLRAAAGAGTPPTFPFVVADGAADWTLLATDEAVSSLVEELEAAGIGFDVASVTPVTEPDDPLTPRQRRLVRAALRRGYFETPRDCSLGELAAELGLAKSTCSESLRRAERTLFSRYLGADTVPAGDAA